MKPAADRINHGVYSAAARKWERLAGVISEITGATAVFLARGDMPRIEIIQTPRGANPPAVREKIIELVEGSYERFASSRGMVEGFDEKTAAAFTARSISHPNGGVSGVICLIHGKRPLKKSYRLLLREFSLAAAGELEKLCLEQQLRQEREKKNRVEMALASSKQGVWDWDREKNTQYVDEKYAEMLGYTVDELAELPVKWEKLIHPEDKDMVRERLAGYTEGLDEPFFEWELRFRDKAGKWKWILSRGRIIRTDSRGRPAQIIGTHLDIHERKEIELRLKQSEAKFKNYISNAPIGIFVANCQGNFIEVNEKAAEITGYSKGELLKKTIFNFYQKKNSAELIRSFKKQNRLSEVHQIIKRDGSLHYVKVNAVKIAGDRFIGFVEDINQRIQAEKELARQKGYFQQLFDKSPDGIAILNNEGQIIKINQSFKNIFGVKEPDVMGRDINDIIVPEERKNEGEELTRKVKNGEMYIGESVRQTKTGQQVHVLIYGYPITLEENQLGIYAVYKNITERKREEEKVKYLSFHDQLTGLYNRRYFENEMSRLNKSRELPISIIVADIDDLKKINDQFGHKEGDAYLQRAARIIKQSTRDADIVARIGGDEFAAVLPSTGLETALDIKKRIIEQCLVVSKNLEHPISISVGAAAQEDYELGLEDVFIQADNSMYDNKIVNKE